jgi:hypothetical protein
LAFVAVPLLPFVGAVPDARGGGLGVAQPVPGQLRLGRDRLRDPGGVLAQGGEQTVCLDREL